MPCPGLNLPGQILCRLARRFQPESGSGIVSGFTQLVCLKIEPAQHQVHIGQGLQFQRLVSLHPGSGGIAGPLTTRPHAGSLGSLSFSQSTPPFPRALVAQF